MMLMQVASLAQTEAVARLDTNRLLIGDQTTLEITFSGPAEYEVIWPMITDTIIKEVEVLKHSELSSAISQDQSSKLYRQSYTITSFDSGFFAIPPFRINYRVPGDTSLHFSETDALLLSVNTVPVNLEAEFKDIKGPMTAPFTFKEALPYILIFLGIVLGGFLIHYYIRKRKKAEPIFKVPASRKIPADQLAIDAFESLRHKKLWQNGEIKQYHTELTDIVREYLWAQWNVHAHEFTTDEIMTAVNGTPANFQAKEKLHQTLVLGDMVKFAKMQPLPLEHDSSLNNAIDFVRETRHLSNQADNSSQQEMLNDAMVSEEEQAPAIKLTDVQGKEVKDVE